MINLKFIFYYLKISITQNRFNRILHLNQEIYLKKMFNDHEMWKCSFVIIFIKEHLKLISNNYQITDDLRLRY